MPYTYTETREMPEAQVPRCRQCSGAHDHDLYGNSNHRIIRPTNGRAPYWMSICRSCESTNNHARRIRAAGTVPPITSAPLGLGRKFGVEIECYLPGGRHGYGADAVRNALPTGWKLKSDGSLGSEGVEIVGPPLTGEAGLGALKTVLELLATNGATVNRRCGLHVHHDASDIGRNGLVLFARSWAANQSLIDFLVAPSRRNGQNSYCRPLTTSELQRMGSWTTESRNLPDERYRTVNLRSFVKYGTVEIRQHQGTLSYRKIEGWIKLAQGLLDSVSGRNIAHSFQGNLRSLFAAANLDEDTAAYFLGRAMQFGASATLLGLQAVAA